MQTVTNQFILQLNYSYNEEMEKKKDILNNFEK